VQTKLRPRDGRGAKLQALPGVLSALIVTPLSTLTPGTYQVSVDPTEGAAVASIGGVSLRAPARSVNGERVVTRFSVADAAR
jgi:hypothetical protein